MHRIAIQTASGAQAVREFFADELPLIFEPVQLDRLERGLPVITKHARFLDLDARQEQEVH